MTTIETLREELAARGTDSAVSSLEEACTAGRLSPLRIGAVQLCPSECLAREVAQRVDVDPPELGVDDCWRETPGGYADAAFRGGWVSDEERRAVAAVLIAELEEVAPSLVRDVRKRLEGSVEQTPEDGLLALLGTGPPTLHMALHDAFKDAVEAGVVSWEWVNELVSLQLLQPSATATKPPARLSRAGRRTVEVLGRALIELDPEALRQVAAPDLDVAGFLAALEARYAAVREREGDWAIPLGHCELAEAWRSLEAVPAQHAIPKLDDFSEGGVLWMMCRNIETLWAPVLFALTHASGRVGHLRVLGSEGDA